MRMKWKKRWTALLVLVAFAGFVYLNNSSLFARAEERPPLLFAHRGMAQTFSMDGIRNDTCTAERIHPPEHAYLENTIPSIEEAFRLGADVVEFDVHPTKDKQFAVFHDWTSTAGRTSRERPSITRWSSCDRRTSGTDTRPTAGRRTRSGEGRRHSCTSPRRSPPGYGDGRISSSLACAASIRGSSWWAATGASFPPASTPSRT